MNILIDMIIVLLILTIISIVSKYSSSNKYTDEYIQLRTKKNNYDKLRNEYIDLYGVSHKEAVQALDRQIDIIRRKHPNKDITWYIDKAIYDLKRDRHII